MRGWGAWWRDYWQGVLVTLIAAVALLTLLNVQDPLGLLPIVQAAGPVLSLGAVVAAVAMARRSLVGVCAATAAMLAAVLLAVPLLADVVHRHPQQPVPASDRPEGTLTVLSSNTLVGLEDPDLTMSQVRQLQPDVLVLVEESPLHWHSVVERGLLDEMPYATGTVGGSEGTVVVTREPMTCVDLPPEARCNEVIDLGTAGVKLDQRAEPLDRFHSPVVRLADGTLFRGIHLWSPRLYPLQNWYRDQQQLGEWLRAQSDERLVLAGDFNASRSHPVFRKHLNHGGRVESAEHVEQLRGHDGLVQAPSGYLPWTRTWPQGWLVPPFVQIDHVLARGYTVTAAGVLPAKASDHAAVWAQLAPRTPPTP